MRRGVVITGEDHDLAKSAGYIGSRRNESTDTCGLPPGRMPALILSSSVGIEPSFQARLEVA
jgi:hypothetical protein